MNLTVPTPSNPETDHTWMKHALKLASQAAELDEVPVGCVVVDGHGHLVGEGFNERESLNDPTAHAEMIAIRNAAKNLIRWRLSDCTLYVTLEPCFMCAGAIVNSRIGRVVYAAQDPKAGACESLSNVLTDARLNHRCEVETGLLKDEAAQLLKTFFKLKRK